MRTGKSGGKPPHSTYAFIGGNAGPEYGMNRGSRRIVSIFVLISEEKVLGIWPIQSFRHVLGLQSKRAEPGLMQRKAINGVWRVRIWRLGGWGCRGRHFSRTRGNPDRRRGLWECRPAAHRRERG